MANLIPAQAKKELTVEYWVRVASVWLCLLGVVALTLVILNVPAYLLIKNQLTAFEDVYVEASERKNSFEQVESDIVLANKAAVLLRSTSDYQLFTPLLNQIEALANSGIAINRFELARVEKTPEEIIVYGQAATREALVSFSDSIEENEQFGSADIPLSNLAKDSNIPFTINVEISKVDK